MSKAENKVQNDSAELVQESYDGQLYRNNSGTAFDPVSHVPVRFGLGHTSAKEIKVYASSDQIGIIPITITQAMVGKKVGVFAAMENKKPGWILRDSDAGAQAQANFGSHIRQMGGIFGFTTQAEHVTYHVEEYIKCLEQK